MFQLEAGEFTYTGSAIKPKVSSSLPEGSYSVAYDNNVDAGTAVVRITGTGAYPGTCEIPFTISPADIAATDVEVSQLLTDESSSPATKLTFNGKTLQEGVDYRVSYADRRLQLSKGLVISRERLRRASPSRKISCIALPARKRPIPRR